MRKISQKVKNEILNDPFYDRCARSDEGCCDGRITWEHAFIYAGKQIDERWAIIPLCTYHHAVDEHQGGGDLKKDLNEYIALERAKELGVDLYEKYPRRDWIYTFKVLSEKYGE